ncbi:MAG: lysylphosphatidylglycerol synthase transmembrane domain-containing protein [Candidatus Nitrospinota bacterium M3_3B_026]
MTHPPEPRAPGRLSLKPIARFGAAFLLLAVFIYVFRGIEWRRLWQVDMFWLLMSFLSLAGVNLVAAARWRYVLGLLHKEKKIGVVTLFYLNATSNMLNIVGLGAGVSMAARPLLLRTEAGVGLAKGAYSVMVDRILDPLLSAIVAAVTLAYLTGALELEQAGWALGGIGALMLLAAALSDKGSRRLFTSAVAVMEWMLKITAGLWRRLKGGGEKGAPSSLAGASKALENLSPRVLLGYSMARLALFALRMQFMAYAFNVPLPFVLALLGLGVVVVATLAVPTPGGIGVEEWSWLGLCLHYGMTASDAALMAVGFRLLGVLLALAVYLVGLGARMISADPAAA